MTTALDAFSKTFATAAPDTPLTRHSATMVTGWPMDDATFEKAVRHAVAHWAVQVSMFGRPIEAHVSDVTYTLTVRGVMFEATAATGNAVRIDVEGTVAT